jgi:hypothetical protein
VGLPQLVARFGQHASDTISLSCRLNRHCKANQQARLGPAFPNEELWHEFPLKLFRWFSIALWPNLRCQTAAGL